MPTLGNIKSVPTILKQFNLSFFFNVDVLTSSKLPRNL